MGDRVAAIGKNEADAIKGMTEIEDATDQEDQAQERKKKEERNKGPIHTKARKDCR